MLTNRLGKLDYLASLIFVIFFGLFIYLISNQISEIVFEYDSLNTWFEGDIPRIFENMTSRYSNHYRTKVHPLFSIASYPLVKVTATLLKISAIDAVRIVSSLLAGLWIGILFLILRGMGCRTLDTLIFTLLSGVSAASLFWLSVPETYVWGSITILLALGFVLVSQNRQFSWQWYATVSAITFSMTITNWMVGIFVTLTKYPGISTLQKESKKFFENPKIRVSINNLWKTWNKFLLIQSSALILIFSLAFLQIKIFPTATLNYIKQGEELNYLTMPESGGPLRSLASMLMHTIIMPEIRIQPKEGDPFNWPFMLTQLSAPGSGTAWGYLAIFLWLGLLALGVWSFFKVKGHNKFRFVLGLTLLGQIGLHLVYGSETFLYSLHIFPLLLLTVAFVSLTSFRPFGLILAGALVFLIGLNNFQQFQVATDLFQQYGPPRQIMKSAMQRRSTDPWPRGTGHIVLGIPGSYEEEKAYHEPGGSFSPVADSFGVSFWVTDSSGVPVATSDDLPLDTIQQRFSDENSVGIPGVITETEFYQAQWQAESESKWQLKLAPNLASENSLAIMIRSVGPAGGSIDSLDWDGQRLIVRQTRKDLCFFAQDYEKVNLEYFQLTEISHFSLADRCQASDFNAETLQWSLKLDPQPKAVYIGHEGDDGWMTATPAETSWAGKDGWGFARLELNPADEITLSVERLNPAPLPSLKSSENPFKLTLPDQQFVDSLEAQIAHLKMSLVENQPRPGEPINYPLPWQRDGAYTIVALARAGQVDIAKELALYFAEHDFFGGFGPEADAPGLSLWAIEEVATQAQDPAFDQQIWPHVKRKAEWIQRMLYANETLYESVTAPVVPSVRNDPELDLVADPAQDGLIMGRMDHHRPVLFVNAVSYRGLIAASELADRLGYMDEKTSWQDQAEQIHQAWSKQFRNDENENDRTYISSLWPSWVVNEDLDLYQDRLTSRLSQLRASKENGTYSPAYTYFDIAEAHQWLYLGQTEPVWEALTWFWQNQASPGLYTWWEGEGEENTSNFWKFIRGWVEPPHVTPHYWSASEMLLLQLDALAYIDRSTTTPELVVAGGIPADWFEQPMTVENLPIEGRTVSWVWNGESLQVSVDGAPINVRMGPNVPQQAKST